MSIGWAALAASPALGKENATIAAAHARASSLDMTDRIRRLLTMDRCAEFQIPSQWEHAGIAITEFERRGLGRRKTSAFSRWRRSVASTVVCSTHGMNELWACSLCVGVYLRVRCVGRPVGAITSRPIHVPPMARTTMGSAWARRTCHTYPTGHHK